MNGAVASVGVIREKLREFDRVATALKIPRKERLAILNTTESVYTALQSAHPTAGVVAPELERRLSYAMPLMRRLASNTIDIASQDSVSQSPVTQNSVIHRYVAA